MTDRPPLWRVKHWAEAGRTEPSNRPEVWPFFPNHFVNFREDWQLLSKSINPRISPKKWTSFYGYNVWITNKQGFGMKTPRANFVTRENLKAALPKCELLTCGGNILTGTVSGNNLVVTVLDGLAPAPTLEWLQARPWFITTAVNWYTSGAVGRFPQGQLPSGEVVPCLHPLIGDPKRYPVITIPLSCLEKWEHDYLPDPFKFY